MNLLQQLTIKEGTDLSRLPVNIINEIKKNIRKGAEDLSQNWANSLELVHRAYYISGIERPTPSMKTAWEQYEEMLVYAVHQLANNRGQDGDWRMSSQIFREALNTKSFKVQINQDNYIIESQSIQEVISLITENTPTQTVTRTDNNNQIKLELSDWGIRQAKVLITELPNVIK